MSNYREYRANKIESGQTYQDFVVDVCWDLLGLAVVQYSSKTYQQSVGESRTGVEIKHDEIYYRTYHLWIEVGEKAQPRPGDYAPSGIYRDDNTWLYVIGDYDTVFVFPKKILRALYKSDRYQTLENKTKTSKGFRLPHEDAMKYAASVLHPNASDKIVKCAENLHEIGRELHQAVKDAGAQQMRFWDLPESNNH